MDIVPLLLGRDRVGICSRIHKIIDDVWVSDVRGLHTGAVHGRSKVVEGRKRHCRVILKDPIRSTADCIHFYLVIIMKLSLW